MAPEISPSTRPFAEALAFHRGRASMSPKNFYALVGEARTRAWTISGGLRESAIFEAHRMLGDAIEAGMTKDEFGVMFGELLDRQDGVVLSPQRMELIWQNAWATSHSVGRYRQLSDPAVIKSRPIRQYPKGPHDARTSRVCLKLEGLMWRAGDAIEKHIWPPNHHNERHVDIVSMTEAQAAEEGGEIYESVGEREYPTIDGQELFPDPGWDSAPHLMAADDGELVRQARGLGEALPSKSAADYGLARLTEIPRGALAEAPGFTPPLAGLAPSDVAAARASFREVFEIPDGLTGSWVADYAGDAVRVSDATFDTVLGVGVKGSATKSKAAEAIRFRHFRAALEDPTEVWFERRANGEITKRYIKVFAGLTPNDPPSAVVLERGPGGWLMHARTTERGALERARRGVLVTSKAPPSSRNRVRPEKRPETALYGGQEVPRPERRERENTHDLGTFNQGFRGIGAEVRA